MSRTALSGQLEERVTGRRSAIVGGRDPTAPQPDQRPGPGLDGIRLPAAIG